MKPPVRPGYRRAPKRLDDETPAHQYELPEDMYRHQYFEVLECVTGEISRRFQQKDFNIVSTMESVLLNGANGSATDSPIPTELTDMYSKDINMDRLKVQLAIVPDLIKCSLPDVK